MSLSRSAATSNFGDFHRNISHDSCTWPQLGGIRFSCDDQSRAGKLHAARLGGHLNPQRRIPREVGSVQRTI